MTSVPRNEGGSPTPLSPKRDEGIIETLQKLAAEQGNISTSPRVFTSKPTPINEKLEKARKQQIENDNTEKDQRLKEETLRKLFRFLTAETIVIFLLAFLQGFGGFGGFKVFALSVGWHSFKLDEWSFRIVITATLGQITAMLTIAVQHLFPKKK